MKVEVCHISSSLTIIPFTEKHGQSDVAWPNILKNSIGQVLEQNYLRWVPHNVINPPQISITDSGEGMDSGEGKNSMTVKTNKTLNRPETKTHTATLIQRTLRQETRVSRELKYYFIN